MSTTTNGPAEQPGSNIPIPSLPNLRDLGGWPTRGGGSVRRGQVFRSTALHALADEDVASFGNLGIRTVYDLRTEAEKAKQPDRVLDGVDYRELDVVAGGNPDVLLPVLGVEAKYLEASLDEMRAQYGAIERYFADGLRIDAPTRSALRAALRE